MILSAKSALPSPLFEFLRNSCRTADPFGSWRAIRWLYSKHLNPVSLNKPKEQALQLRSSLKTLCCKPTLWIWGNKLPFCTYVRRIGLAGLQIAPRGVQAGASVLWASVPVNRTNLCWNKNSKQSVEENIRSSLLARATSYIRTPMGFPQNLSKVVC